MKEKINVDELGAEKSDDFEKQLQDELRPVIPNAFFRSSLKEKLAQSKVFQQRKETGAWSVLTLSTVLVGLVLAGISVLLYKRCSKKT